MQPKKGLSFNSRCSLTQTAQVTERRVVQHPGGDPAHLGVGEAGTQQAAPSFTWETRWQVCFYPHAETSNATRSKAVSYDGAELRLALQKE